MIFLSRFLALVLVASSALGAEEPGAKPVATFDQVRVKFAEPEMKHAPVDTAKARDIAGKLIFQRIHPG